MFGLSAVTGKLHDEGYTKHLLVVGSIIYVVCVQMVSLANQYYSIFLAQGLGMGIGIGTFKSLFTLSVHLQLISSPSNSPRLRASPRYHLPLLPQTSSSSNRHCGQWIQYWRDLLSYQ